MPKKANGRNKKSVVKHGTVNTLAEIPAYLKTEGDLGVDSIKSTDIQIPRLKICQPTSTDIKDTIDINDGDLYNSLTQDNYGSAVDMFILLFWKSMVWFTDDFKLRCIAYRDNETKEVITFGNEVESCMGEDKDEGKLAHNYMIIRRSDLKSNDIPLPSIYSVMSAGIKYAKQLNGRIKMNATKQVPIYAQLVRITTKLYKFTKGQAYMPQFSYPEYATKEEFEKLSVLHYQAKKLQQRSDIVAASGNGETESDDGIPF